MMMMMTMTMMTNIIPYWRTRTHIWEKVLMGVWASAIAVVIVIFIAPSSSSSLSLLSLSSSLIRPLTWPKDKTCKGQAQTLGSCQPTLMQKAFVHRPIWGGAGWSMYMVTITIVYGVWWSFNNKISIIKCNHCTWMWRRVQSPYHQGQPPSNGPDSSPARFAAPNLSFHLIFYSG